MTNTNSSCPPLRWGICLILHIFLSTLVAHREWNPNKRPNSACVPYSQKSYSPYLFGAMDLLKFLLCPFYNQKPVSPLDCTVFILYYHSFYSYDHELVFGVSLKNMNKAERLTFGESLMTHAMTFTAVSEKV